MENKLSSIESWTCEDVGAWLKEIGFDKYIELFTTTHQIDGKVLLSLTEIDLRHPPLQLKILGDIKRLASHLHVIQSCLVHPVSELGNESSSSAYLDEWDGERRILYTSTLTQPRIFSKQDDSEFDEVDGTYLKTVRHVRNMDINVFPDIPPEIWKTLLSFVYVFSVFMLTAFVMVVVHDRVPEMDKYPPLPDLFLDNMPYVPWAFQACELVGIALAFMWFTLLVFHRHRFVLMRRMFSLMGTIFLLRCVTMLITSLSVPGRHLQCSGKRYGDWYSRFYRTFEIWKAMGMSLQGVQSCGDYMFSGHTSIITLFNFFITEYTPRKYYYVHIISWVLNFFGIFFLLAAHEHYSIDVFMAFYLSSRLFMYYHTLANNRALMAPDARRTRVWFPLFAFFESKCEGRVPNHFEHPITQIASYFKMFSIWAASSNTNTDQDSTQSKPCTLDTSDISTKNK